MLFRSQFAPAIMTMLADLSRMIGRQPTGGSLISERIGTSDGSTRKLENLIVTTVPYLCSRQEKSIWLDRGSTIRNQTGMPWIVLHHVPGKTGLGVSGEESDAAEVLATYKPDYLSRATIMRFRLIWPKLEPKTGWGNLARAGQLLSAPFPNHIKLDTESGETLLAQHQRGMGTGGRAV
jgi:hypothetical protein